MHAAPVAGPERVHHAELLEEVLVHKVGDRHASRLCGHRTGELQVGRMVTPHRAWHSIPWPICKDFKGASLRGHLRCAGKVCSIETRQSTSAEIIGHHATRECQQVVKRHSTPNVSWVKRPPMKDLIDLRGEMEVVVWIGYRSDDSHGGRELGARRQDVWCLHIQSTLGERVQSATCISSGERHVREELVLRDDRIDLGP
mmetsp:Transcript_3677/g.7854  ORF Transcript_3677/g.7854 Transcript_3677/m.7854 type:complete len:200 (+) Transcript_3677:840-1439(+)